MKKVLVVLFVMIGSLAFAQNGPSPAKKVNLSWTQSTTTGVTANGVYRATTSGGPYTNVTVTSTPATSFVDANVTPGNSYFYVVTAKTSATDESAYSNEVKASIPLATAAPTGLSATVQ